MAITPIEGERLVGSHSAGDPDAFPAIVKAHYPALLARARRRLGEAQAAEDAVQETLLRAYRGLPRFGGFGEFHLSAWLYRILENVCVDEAHRRQRRSAVLERLAGLAEESEPPAEAFVHVPDRQFTTALGQLSESYRAALIQREVEGLSYADMAVASGISEDNARARVSRARIALRRLMAPIMTALAWLIATSRRGERPLLDGTAQAASAGAVTAPAAVHLPAATQLISQVTMVGPDYQVVSAIKVATAAVLAVALPVGGVTAANRRADTPPAPPAIEVTQAEHPASAAAANAAERAEGDSEAGNEERVTAAEAGDLADAEGTVSVAAVEVGGEDRDGDTDIEAVDGADPAATPAAEDEAVSGDGGQVADEPPPAPSSAIVIDATEAVRTVLDDGRYELAGPVSFATPNGEMPANISLTSAVPVEGDAEGTEYRLAGSIATRDGTSARIRLSGKMEAWSVDEDGRTTYVFSGRYVTTDGAVFDIPPRGSFTASFRDDGLPELVIRLVPDDSSTAAP